MSHPIPAVRRPGSVIRLADMDILHRPVARREVARLPDVPSSEAAAWHGASGAPLSASALPLLPAHTTLKYTVRFKGASGGWRAQWWRAVLFHVLTLGWGRPWGVANTRRFLFEHTELADHAFLYRAVAWHAVPFHLQWLLTQVAVAALVIDRGRTPLSPLALAAVLWCWPALAVASWRVSVRSVVWGDRRLGCEAPVLGGYRALWPCWLPALGALALQAFALRPGASDGGAPGLWLVRSAVVTLAAISVLAMPVSWWRWTRWRLGAVALGPLRLCWKGRLTDVVQWAARSAVMAGLLAAVVGGATLAAWSLWTLEFGRSAAASWGWGGLAVGAWLLGVVWRPYVALQGDHLLWRHLGSPQVRFKRSGSLQRQVVNAMWHRALCWFTLGLFAPEARLRAWRRDCRALTLYTRLDPEVLRHHWPH